MANKPLLFGDDRSDVDRYNPRAFRGHRADPSRIPGWSEIVAANDVAKADDLYFREQHRENPKINTKEDVYKALGAHPQPLDVDFKWLPISGVAGADNGRVQRTLDHYINEQGFRLATKEDLTERGFGFPPTARKAEDGTIRRGPDTALYIRSGEVARMWEEFRAEEAARAEGNDPDDAFTAGSYAAPTFASAERTKEDIQH